MEKNPIDRIMEQCVQKANDFVDFQRTLYLLIKLRPEQLIEKLEQGWQLTPPNRDELDALFEGMAKLGTEEANIHPDGDEQINTQKGEEDES